VLQGLSLLALLALALPAAPSAADKKMASPPPKAGAGKKKPALAAPPGTVIAVYEDWGDALKAMPDGIVISPKTFADMVEELARLRAQLERRKRRAITPSKCLLKGKIDGSLVVLQAQVEFTTRQADAVVALACGQAHATGVSLDGATPQLLGGARATGADPEGFSVEVEKPGNHSLTLDLILPLAARPGGHGFSLDLPRCPVTRLELELPPGVKDARCGGKTLAEAGLALKGNQVAGFLGVLDQLELTWKGAGSAGAAVLAAEGLVQVRLDLRDLACQARLTLRPLGGQVAEWRLLVPRHAELKVAPADEARVAKIDRVEQQKVAVHTIRLKEAGADPLTVTVATHAPVPKLGTRAGVGPFTLLGATRQTGSLLVSSTAGELHLEFHPQGHLARREVSDEEQRRDANLLAAFRYGHMAGPADKPGPDPWLEVEAETVRGQVKARVAHTLTLDGDRSSWRVKTVITGTPRWADVGQFQVLLPPGCEFNEESAFPLPERVLQVGYDKAKRVVEFRLARGSGAGALRNFTVGLEANYTRPGDEPATSGRAVLRLPRPRAAEEGGEVTVRVPRDVELLTPDERAAGDLELVRQGTHELVWRGGRHVPERVEVRWRPWRPQVRVSGVVDLTLAAGSGRVRHELSFHFPQPTPPQLSLRVPPAVAASLRVADGGRLAGAGPGEVRLVQPGAPSGRTHRIVLEYSFAPTLRNGGVFAVPLVVPEAVTQGETRVRVWAEPGALPARVGGAWGERDVEVVPGRVRLPALVLRGEGVDLPLSLRLGPAEAAPTVLVERALVRAEVGEAGVQTYRAGYRLGRLSARHLDVELPAPVAALGLRVWLDAKEVTPEAVDESGAPSDGGRVARLRLAPSLVGRGAVLELRYQLPPGRSGRGPLQTTLQPPVVRGHPGGVPTRWQVTLPADWVAVAPEAGPGARRAWGRRGWLLAPHLALTTADLERWFRGGAPAATPPDPEADSETVPSLVCWRDSPEPLVVTHVPQQAWLLVCSLGVLVVGLGLSWLTWPAGPRAGAGGWLWPALALLGLGLVVAALVWPNTLGQIAYGCQPGAAVLVAVAGLQWLLHERYRRRIIFLPSFSRGRPGSSLARADGTAGTSARPAGEPSTVDHPRPAGSSAGS
jgi:hypothetical protein